MSVSMFANALRLRVLTATRVALPASSLIAFRTALAVPKNVSLSVSQSFTTSQVARTCNDTNELENDASRTASLCIGNIPWKVKKDEVAQVFAKFGQVTSVAIHVNPRGQRVAHVNFASKDSAVATLASVAQEPIHMADRKLRVELQDVIDPSERLFFTNFAGGEPEIRTIFKQFSDSIIDIELLKNSRSSTFGYIIFNSMETAKDALKALKGTQAPDGKTLVLSYARPQRNPSIERSSYGLGLDVGNGELSNHGLGVGNGRPIPT